MLLPAPNQSKHIENNEWFFKFFFNKRLTFFREAQSTKCTLS